MFIHHTMTDREILRVVGNSESQVTRLVADRLDTVLARLEEINRICASAGRGTDAAILLETVAALSKAQ